MKDRERERERERDREEELIYLNGQKRNYRVFLTWYNVHSECEAQMMCTQPFSTCLLWW